MALSVEQGLMNPGGNRTRNMPFVSELTWSTGRDIKSDIKIVDKFFELAKPVS